MVRVRVSSRVRVIVSFIFYCILCFAMYVKRQKINTRVSCLGSSVVTVLAFYHTGPGLTPSVRKYFCTVRVSFSLNVSFRVTVKFNMRHKELFIGM